MPERVKAFFLFGPCNRAAVGGSAALRMRHTPCGYGPFLFWQDQKGPPPRPARWGEEEQGSGRSFRRRRKRSLADFATTTMGGHCPAINIAAPRVQWDALPYLFRQKYGPHSASWVWAYVQVKSLSTTYQSAPRTAPASAVRDASSSAVTGRTRGSPSGGYSL